jgi:tetratricopeptide (TPR) repeat protein
MNVAITETHETTMGDKITERLNMLCPPAIAQLRSILRSHFLFNLGFSLLLALEITILFVAMPPFGRSAFVAVAIATGLVTLFSYLVLRLYMNTRKPEQMHRLHAGFLDGCRQLLGYQSGVPAHHLAIAQSATRLAKQLHDQEYRLVRAPKALTSLEPLLSRLSCWLHWTDCHQLREQLLFNAVQEHIEMVKLEPTNLQVHAALANAYVTLSTLYAPRPTDDEERWIPRQRQSPQMHERFRATAQKAIEQLKILSAYAPSDPWIHAQLAYSYRDLQMPAEEIRSYERILELSPDDRETLYKLGVLYFQQGRNADGLRAYERLRQVHPKRASDLIKFYGS